MSMEIYERHLTLWLRVAVGKEFPADLQNRRVITNMTGLCYSFWGLDRLLDREIGRPIRDSRYTLKKRLVELFGPSEYPFDKDIVSYRSSNTFENPKRLAFVRSEIERARYLYFLKDWHQYALTGDHNEENPHYAVNAGLCCAADEFEDREGYYLMDEELGLRSVSSILSARLIATHSDQNYPFNPGGYQDYESETNAFVNPMRLAFVASELENY